LLFSDLQAVCCLSWTGCCCKQSTLHLLLPNLPARCVASEGTQLQMVKVGCRGLAVVRVEAAPGAGDSPPVNMTALVGQVLDQIQTGRLKHTK